MSDTPNTSAQKHVANHPNPALPRADSIRPFFFTFYTYSKQSFLAKKCPKRALFWDPLKCSFYRDFKCFGDFYEIM